MATEARLTGRDIVCFANDWDGDPLSKKHIMRRFAEDNRVLWVESLGNRAPRASGRDLARVAAKLRKFAGGLREVERNLWVLTPLAVPAYGSRAVARVNGALVGATVRRAMRRLGFARPLSYTFVPASAWVVGRLGEERVVYHCVDEYAAFAGAGDEIRRLERVLLERADLTIVCSQPLLERKRRDCPRTALVRHGVDHAHFARALDPATPIPADLAKLPRPVIGFHGLVAEWIDRALLRKLADALPGASLAIVGDRTVDAGPLAGAPNVHWLGRKRYFDLPGYCRGFDVAVLPFVLDDLTVHASPLKLREYLAAGLPVVATAIPEARLLPGVRVAENADRFISEVKAALLDEPGPRRERSDAVAGESWDHQLAKLHALVASL